MATFEERKKKTRETKAKAEKLLGKERSSVGDALCMGRISVRGVVELSRVWRSFRGVG